MIIFNQDFMPNIHETLAQMMDAFNEASGGAIRLTLSSNIGDYINTSFYDGIQDNRRRVDRYAANSSVAAVDLTQSEHVAVKVAGGFGPIRYLPSQMTWLRKATAEGIEQFSRQFAETLMQDQLNTGILAAVAAISNQATATNDVSGGATITQAAINGAHAKFGDASQRIITSVMNGVTYHELVSLNLVNAQELFQAGNVTVVDILGKRVVITDAPALLNTTPTPDTNTVLGLVEGGLTILDPADPIVNIQTNNGNEMIETTMQADYDFTVDLKGYAWDKTNGGASPTDADLSTGSNWDLDQADIKNTAGVVTIGDVA
jgi:hypothetical protein